MSHAYFARSSIYPFFRVLLIDSATNLKSSWFQDPSDGMRIGHAICRTRYEPGQAARASFAAASLPPPSLMTCPPTKFRFLYNRAKSAGLWLHPYQDSVVVRNGQGAYTRLAMKFVFSSSGLSSDSVPPMICTTCPSCRSIQGLNILCLLGRVVMVFEIRLSPRQPSQSRLHDHMLSFFPRNEKQTSH